MKKIINGRKYDTNTAERVGYWENMYDKSNFHYFNETLYRKRTGEFFLDGESHGLSKYGENNGGGWGWGRSICPLSEDEAREWAETHLDADEYEDLFGEVPE